MLGLVLFLLIILPALLAGVYVGYPHYLHYELGEKLAAGDYAAVDAAINWQPLRDQIKAKVEPQIESHITAEVDKLGARPDIRERQLTVMRATFLPKASARILNSFTTARGLAQILANPMPVDITPILNDQQEPAPPSIRLQPELSFGKFIDKNTVVIPLKQRGGQSINITWERRGVEWKIKTLQIPGLN